MPRRHVTVLVAAPLAFACSDSPTEPGSGAPAAVIVQGAPGTIGVGDTTALSARVVDAGGRALATPAVAWRSLDTAVAHVEANGRVMGWDAGTARIVAEAGTAADTVALSVEVQARRLDIFIDGTPTTDSARVVRLGTGISLRPVLLDGRGRTLTSNEAPAFTVDDTAIAVVSSWVPSGGYANSYGKVAGRVTYRVRLAGVEGQASVRFSLGAIVLQGLGLAQVALGGEHACGLDAAGIARCWGRNDVGQLGRATDPDGYQFPISAVTGAPAFARIVARGGGSCGLTAAQRLWCWGTSALPARTASATPILDGVAIADVGIGADGHACALTGAGEVWCWGPDAYPSIDSVPVKLATDQRFTQVAVGTEGHGCGLLDTGRAACWASARGPVEPVAGGYGAFTRIDASYWNGCGLTAAGQLWCWFSSGAAGITATAWPTTERFTSFGMGSGFTCGFASASGQVWCNGRNPNYYNQYDRNVPTRIARDEQFRGMLVGDRGVCGMLANGDLRCEGFYATPTVP